MSRTIFFLTFLAAVFLFGIGLITKSASLQTAPSDNQERRGAAVLATNPNDSPDSVIEFSNFAPIIINDGTVASPYGSEIAVSNVPGAIEKLRVTIHNFQHTYPDDADILLVAPNGQSIVLMSDVGGSRNATGVGLTFDDAAPNLLSDRGQIATGIFKPTDFEPNDDFPPPAAPPPRSNSLAAFNGINPNGSWRLFVVDDTGQDSGVIVGGWSLSINNGIVAQNQTPINIPDFGIGSVYPASVNVTGSSGTVTGVKVLLSNLSHAAPDDVDLLLVAPNGRSVVLMSDVGGNVAVNNVSLILTDAAAGALPDNGQIVSGAFKPINVGGGDFFPQPAPNGAPTGASLAVFNGSNPNGIWNLYLVDDAGGNAGVLAGGWSLILETSVIACPLAITPDIQSFSHTGGTGGFTVLSPAGCAWTAAPAAFSFVNITSNPNGEGNGTVSFTVPPNFGGARTGAIEISNNGVTRVFSAQQNSGCPFALGTEAQNFPPGGGAGSVSVTAANNCSWQVTSGANWIEINSTSGGVFGSSITAFTVAPNPGGAPRTGTITIGIRTLTITQAAGTGCPYTLSKDSDYSAAAGRTGSFDVFAASTCNWTATSNANWITINSGSGSGNGAVSFTVAPNFFGNARSGTITVNNQIYRILQGRSNIAPPFDFDGDNITDISVFRPSTGFWYGILSASGGVFAVQFGIATDRLVAADYDGDRRTDLAVFRNGFWYILGSAKNSFSVVQWGLGGDATVPGDYDGDGKADIAVFRPSSGVWYILRSSDGGVTVEQFGTGTDRPVQADYDGDGKTDFALYRAGATLESPSIWFSKSSNDNYLFTYQFGKGGDVPVPADYDGDGRASFAVFRLSDRTWYRSIDPTGNFDYQQWGLSDDALVPGDYDGDGKIDVAVYRQGIWYILLTTTGNLRALSWGLGDDIPVPSPFKPELPKELTY